MQIPKISIRLSLVAGLLMAFVSLKGMIDPGTYAKETANWAAQAVAQDYINLFLVFPALLALNLLLRRGSLRALLVWLGVLLYLIYSYVLYAFFIHFGPLFLAYVAILGLSFYAFIGAMAALDWPSLSQFFKDAKVKPASLLLAAVGLMFYALWLSDIVGALLGGRLPNDLEAVGLSVNPVQVLDLAFLLPGALIVSVSLWRKKVIGLVLTVPFLTFLILMGAAIISIMIVLAQRGFTFQIPPLVMIAIIITLSAAAMLGFLKKVSND